MTERLTQKNSFLSDHLWTAAWSIADFATGVAAHLVRLDDRARQRRALRGLDDRLLDDIGRSREEALRESGRW